jgi:hypothetical protein
VKTVVISEAEYLADPRKATEQAEEMGRVVVKDASNNCRLIINSHRSTESLVKGEVMGIDRDFDNMREPVVWATDDAPFTGPQVKALLDENEVLRARVAELEGADTAYNAALKHGLMTDNMHELAKTLGLREGKHTAESVAKLATDRIADLERIAQCAEDMRDASDARVAELEAGNRAITETCTYMSCEYDRAGNARIASEARVAELETANASLSATLQIALHDVRHLEEDPEYSHGALVSARAEGWADAMHLCKLLCQEAADAFEHVDKCYEGIGAETCAKKIADYAAGFRKVTPVNDKP